MASEFPLPRAALVALLMCTACPQQPDKCPDAPGCLVVATGDDAGTQKECVAGGWRAAGSGGSCSPIPCRLDGGPAECLHVDCAKHPYTLFVPDSPAAVTGTMFTGAFTYSATGGVWSSVTVPDRFSYSIEGSQLLTSGTSGTAAQHITCTVQQLVLGQLAVKVRLDADASKELEALVLDAGTWTSRPYP